MVVMRAWCGAAAVALLSLAPCFAMPMDCPEIEYEDAPNEWGVMAPADIMWEADPAATGFQIETLMACGQHRASIRGVPQTLSPWQFWFTFPSAQYCVDRIKQDGTPSRWCRTAQRSPHVWHRARSYKDVGGTRTYGPWVYETNTQECCQLALNWQWGRVALMVGEYWCRPFNLALYPNGTVPGEVMESTPVGARPGIMRVPRPGGPAPPADMLAKR